MGSPMHVVSHSRPHWQETSPQVRVRPAIRVGCLVAEEEESGIARGMSPVQLTE